MRNLLTGEDAKFGMDLGFFLLKYKQQMVNTRALYIVEPKLEKGKVIKFGIAGEKTGESWKRLRDYQIQYGDEDRINDCKGVWIWYCGITKYDPNTSDANSEVRKTETNLKRVFKSRTEKGRGTERITINPQKLIDYIQNHKFYDEDPDMKKREEIKVRSSQRQAKIKGKVYEIDKLIKIKTAKGKKLVEVKWKGYKETTFEPYKTIKEDYPEGVASLEKKTRNT